MINTAQAEREAARAALADTGCGHALGEAEVYAMIDSLGDVGGTLKDARPAGLTRLYEGLRLQLRYEPQEQAVYVAASPRVVSAVSEGGLEHPFLGNHRNFRRFHGSEGSRREFSWVKCATPWGGVGGLSFGRVTHRVRWSSRIALRKSPGMSMSVVVGRGDVAGWSWRRARW